MSEFSDRWNELAPSNDSTNTTQHNRWTRETIKTSWIEHEALRLVTDEGVEVEEAQDRAEESWYATME